jgi:hypothetical protein
MTTPLTFECKVHFHRRGHGSRKELRPGEEPLPAVELGWVPSLHRPREDSFKAGRKGLPTRVKGRPKATTRSQLNRSQQNAGRYVRSPHS